MSDVEGAMQTPDGSWRVEVVRRRRTRWYRIVHGADVIDWLSIAAVERILHEAGVDRRSLTEVDPAAEPRPETPESSIRGAGGRWNGEQPPGCRPAAPPL